MMVQEMAKTPADLEIEAAKKEGKIKKAKPEVDFIPQASNMIQTIDLLKGIFDNMKNRKDASVTQYHSPLLSSDPGTGKTSVMNLLSKITGIEMITIEAPHIVEEHIVQIPFIIFNPQTNHETTGKTELEKTAGYKVKMADSNLYTQIRNCRKVSDQDMLKGVYSSTDEVIQMFEYFGGTESEIPEDIKTFRDGYTCILFLDEYFRQTSLRIKNMLRGLLNNKIACLMPEQELEVTITDPKFLAFLLEN